MPPESSFSFFRKEPLRPWPLRSLFKVACLFLLCASNVPIASGQSFEAKDLEKARGLIVFLPERGVSARCQLYIEAKPHRGIIRPFLLSNGGSLEIENALILEEVNLSALFPETMIDNHEIQLSKARELLDSLKKKYPKFLQEWELLAKAQEKEKSLVSQGFVKQKNRWISPTEWVYLQKIQALPQEKPKTRLVTKDGKTYQNAKLSRIDGTTLIITHESGIAKILKATFPVTIDPPDPKLAEAIAKIMDTEEVPAPVPTPAPAPTPTPPPDPSPSQAAPAEKSQAPSDPASGQG